MAFQYLKLKLRKSSFMHCPPTVQDLLPIRFNCFSSTTKRNKGHDTSNLTAHFKFRSFGSICFNKLKSLWSYMVQKKSKVRPFLLCQRTFQDHWCQLLLISLSHTSYFRDWLHHQNHCSCGYEKPQVATKNISLTSKQTDSSIQEIDINTA